MSASQPITSVSLKSASSPTSSLLLLLEPRSEADAPGGDLYITTSLDLRYTGGSRWRLQFSDTHAFALDELEEFENDLIGLEATRRGIAALSCRVPGEFDLFIESIDDAGHMIARVSFIARASVHPNLHFDNPISHAFQFDPGRLAGFARDFREFVAECAL